MEIHASTWLQPGSDTSPEPPGARRDISIWSYYKKQNLPLKARLRSTQPKIFLRNNLDTTFVGGGAASRIGIATGIGNGLSLFTALQIGGSIVALNNLRDSAISNGIPFDSLSNQTIADAAVLGAVGLEFSLDTYDGTLTRTNCN